MTEVMRCEQCGGSIAFDAAKEVARCLFCDSVALHPVTDEPVVPPREAIPFVVDATRADTSFRSWARSSWWYPRELRSLGVGLHRLWLPAWRFEAEVELHWAGLIGAPTRSGRRPASGIDRGPADTMIPASLGLRQTELDGLLPFDEDAAGPWAPVAADPIPHEIPALSRSSALLQAHRLLSESRRRDVARRHHLSRCRASALVDCNDGRLLMLPIWIGSFRYRDRPWRFVINAQTGRVMGRAPLDRLKVTLAIVVALIVAVMVALWVERPEPPRGRGSSGAATSLRPGAP